ncbi:MAG: hypothetical protein WB676_07910 [Bryobacteraceae bacterium]
MSLEKVSEIVSAIEAGLHTLPTPAEFEMAYQARVAIDRIRFAISQNEKSASSCDQIREANLQLLDALDRLENVERKFQIRCARSAHLSNGAGYERRKMPSERSDPSFNGAAALRDSERR